MNRTRAWAAVCLLSACPAAAEFRAAAVKIDITPKTPQWLLGYGPRQSTGVHDNLYHRILAMSDGKLEFFLLSTDIALVSPAFYDDFCRELQKQTGITPMQVWWTVTHTHSAPEVGPAGLPKAFLKGRYEHEPDWEYSRFVMKTLIQGIQDARARLAPARLGVGTGMSMANINRRARDPQGRVSLGLNPDGPVDRQLGVIRVEEPGGRLIALVANYAIHGTVLSGKNQLISGDAPGIVAAYVEDQLGAPMLFVNGAAGDIAPIYSVYPDFKSGHITEFNVLLGDRILAAARGIGAATSEVTLWAGEKIVESPLKPDLVWPDDLAAYLRKPAAGPALVRLPVRFLRLGGDTVAWAAPLELFCEIAIRVRRQSPFPNTFFFGYTNGWLGYLPTSKGFAEGGYETTVTPFTTAAEEQLTQAVVSFLHGLPR